MPLARIGNALLLAASGALATACQCCKRYFCKVARINACGYPVYECGQTDATSPSGEPRYESANCDDQCPEADLCCLEEPCGPCQVCVNAQCVPCPVGFTCVNGSCVPLPPQGSWYCCFEEGGSDTYCQEGPCPEGRLASGPHANSLECDQDCQPHKCVQYDCGGADCEASGSGEYATREACLESCEGIDFSTSPCVVTRLGGDGECPCEYSGGTGTHNFFFSIDPAARRRTGNSVCVSYVSRGSHPINVSLWAPTLGPDCEVVNPRASQGVSGWRGCGQQDCPNDRPPGEIAGGPSGRILWLAKQQGITEFEVQVIAPCDGSDWEITVLCGDCVEYAQDSCCGPCQQVQFAQNNIPNGNCQAVPYGEQTITVPDDCALPVCVRVTGGVDDELLIDGEVIQPGQFPFGACNGAHAVDYSFLLENRSFTVAAGDNHGGGTSYDLEFCFQDPSTCNPLP